MPEVDHLVNSALVPVFVVFGVLFLFMADGRSCAVCSLSPAGRNLISPGRQNLCENSNSEPRVASES